MTDPFGTTISSGPASPERPRGDAEDRALVPRDQYDRYLMRKLDGSKPGANQGFTRVSSIKSGLSNQTGIKKWTGEKIVEGIASNDSLVRDAIAANAIIDPEAKKKALRAVADRAFVDGGGKERSGRGTAFHEVTEELNAGKIDYNTGLARLGEEDGKSLIKYAEALEINQIRVLPGMLERQVLCPYNAAGTFDNMVEMWNPDTEEWELLIGDLKTGRSIDLAKHEIVMQLWMYANAYALWTTTGLTMSDDGTKVLDFEGYYEPMPTELRRDKGVIFHVPLDGTATVYVVDLSKGREWVEAAVTAKRANAEAKHAFRRLQTATEPAFVAPETPAQIMERVPGLAFQGAQAVANGQAAQPIQYPTPDAQTQADKASERMAKINELAIADGRNDEDDEPVSEAADRPLGGGQGQLNGIGQPLAPLAGPGKRGCSVCGRTGHTSKTKQPICLGDRDPAKGTMIKESAMVQTAMASDQTPEPDAAIRPTTEEIAAFVAEQEGPPDQPSGPWQPDGLGGSDLVEPPVNLLPYCPKSHAHNWTSNHPDALGQWVCADTGKPSREVWEKQNALEPHLIPVLAADQADGDDAPPPPATWPVLVDPVAVLIASAENRQVLLTIRQRAIESGTWDPTRHEQAGMDRYNALAQ